MEILTYLEFMRNFYDENKLPNRVFLVNSNHDINVVNILAGDQVLIDGKLYGVLNYRCDIAPQQDAKFLRRIAQQVYVSNVFNIQKSYESNAHYWYAIGALEAYRDISDKIVDCDVDGRKIRSVTIYNKNAKEHEKYAEYTF